MKVLRLICFSLMTALLLALALLVVLPCASDIALADSETETPEFTYEEVKIISPNPDSGIQSQVDYYYYVDDVEGGFGTLTKSFASPASYNVSANIKEELVFAAIEQIVTENNIWMGIGSFWSEASLLIFGNKTLLSCVEYNDISNFKNIDINSGIGQKKISANNEYETNGTYTFIILNAFRFSYIVFNLDPIKIEPFSDGSLIRLHSQYTKSVTHGYESMSVSVRPNGLIFSNNPNDHCYILANPTMGNGLPSTNYTMSYIYDGISTIEDGGYDFDVVIGDTPYTIQGRLDFTTADGDEITLYTNPITVRRHNIEMRIDGMDDMRVGAGVEHEYSFIIDKNDLSDFSASDITVNIYGRNADSSIGGTYTSFYVDGTNLKSSFAFKTEEIGPNMFYLSAITIYANGGMEYIVIEDMVLEVAVLEYEPQKELPHYEIAFSIPENSAALLGGTEFEVSASVNEIYGDEHFDVELTLSGASLSIMSEEKDKLVLKPTGIGRSVLYFSAVSKSAYVRELTATIAIEVVQSNDENTAIVFDRDINITGSDIVARLSVDGFTTFLNYIPNWSVQIEDGEALIDVPFSTDKYGAITVESAQRGYYHFAISGNSVESVEEVKRVTNINVAELARKYLPFLAPIMVLCVLVAFVLRYLSKKRHTLQRRLKKSAALVDAAIKENTNTFNFPSKLKKITHSLRASLAAASMRDQETSGQFQNLCNLINNAVQICIAAKKNHKKLTNAAILKLLRTLKKQYVDEAVRMCRELDEALEKYASVIAVAATVVPTTKGEEKKKQAAMLQRFYKHGDIEDANGRSGDSDRNADTRTEN